MKKHTINYIDQYKFLFYFSWIILYFIFPVWRNPQIYISFTHELIDVPYWTFLFGFMAYFFIASFILHVTLKPIIVDKPLFESSHNWINHIKNNLWLVLICSIAVVLHIFTYTDVWGESVKHALWIYRFINFNWYKLVNMPIQYPAWMLLCLLIVSAKHKKLAGFISGRLRSAYAAYRSSNLVKILFMVFITCLYLLYTQMVPYYSVWDHMRITGYPPFGTLLYLMIYLLFGIGNIFLAPTVVQLTFYLLSGIFLYKTIILYLEKEAAFLGAAIFMFSPLIFAYGAFGQLASGTIFFIILVSHFFLKFIRDGNNKDLILTLCFISIGCLFKRDVIIMFFVCSAYLTGLRLKRKDLRLINSIWILSLSFLSFIPWYIMGTRGADNIVLSQASRQEGLYAACSLLLSQLSLPVFLLLPASIIFIIIFKREKLHIFFGLVFIAYYLLYSGVQQEMTHRYSMALYPTISIFLAQFLYSAALKIPWKHTFKVVSSILIIYMAVLSVIPRSATNLVTFQYSDFEIQSFPFDDAVDWVLNETDDEKILTVIKQSNILLSTPKNIPTEKFYHLPLGEIFSMWPSNDTDIFREKLNRICKQLEISYIMFPVSDAIITHPRSNPKAKDIISFLKKNQHDDFMLAAKFNVRDNYIYIYKVQSGPAKKK